FLPHKGEPYSFETLSSPEKVEDFFSKEFPDVLELIPNLMEQFFHNPIGNLGTIKCSPWHHSGKVLIMGDAAHAMVPFYAQGMNSSFEDVAAFMEVLSEHKSEIDKGQDVWATIFETFQNARIKNAEAICDLSLDNFEEMKAHTGLPIFQAKRKLEIAFETEFPDEYNSKYSLVTFRENIPYAQALAQGRAQDTAILTMIYKNELNDSLSLKEKLDLVKERTTEILEDEGPDYLKYTEKDF
ncbi:MAG TPA: FAD-dependent monooxygenase, partial [Flavobacteriaceae bacterium]|nr:FAD-dependent monooxygenase [Flavobacteriaceae bacterium]